MPHGDGGAFGPPPTGQAVVLRREVRALASSGGPRRFDERAAEVPVALARPPALPLPRALVLPRTELPPRAEMLPAREPAHARADLGGDLLGGAAAPARDRLQALELPLKRAQPLGDLRIEPSDAPIELVDVAELLAQHEPLVGAHEALERFDQVRAHACAGDPWPARR